MSYSVNVTSDSEPMNRTTTTTNVADAVFDKTARLIVLYVQIVFGALGSSLVCVWLVVNRRRTSRVNTIIRNLAFADILVISFACVMQVIWEHVDRLWLAGDVMCRVLKYAQSFAIMSSVNMLVVLSIDRHQAIIRPLRPPPSAMAMAAVGWSVSALMSIPQLGIYSVNVVANKTVCESVFRRRPISHRQAYLTFINLVVFFIPSLVMFVCYFRIFSKISAKADWTASVLSTGEYKSDSIALTSIPSVERKRERRCPKMIIRSTQPDMLPRAKIKSLQMAVVIVSTFICCSTPYHLLELVYSYGSHDLVPALVAGIAGAMAVANSVTNPFVVLLFNVKWPCRSRSGGTSRRLTRTEHTTDLDLRKPPASTNAR